MAQKLIRIKRGVLPRPVHHQDGWEMDLIPGVKMNEDIPYTKHQEFFLVDARGVNEVVEFLAKENPGCEIEVYNLEMVGQCPAGDYVMKQVTADGVLPF